MSTTGIAAEHSLSNGALQLHTSVRQEINEAFGDSTAWQATVMGTRSAWRTSCAASVGIKSPTFIERFGYTPDQFYGNPELQSEKSLQHRVALEYDNEQKTLTLIAYVASLRDEINGFAYDKVRNQFTATNLDRNGRRRGVEVRLMRTFRRGTISANYALVKSTEGAELKIRRPKHLANLSLVYALGDRVRTRNDLHVMSRQLDRDFSTAPAKEISLDAYILGNTTVEYDLTPKLTLHEMIENILNTAYAQIFGYRTVGRTFSIGARVEI